jgi:hypothetical protein
LSWEKPTRSFDDDQHGGFATAAFLTGFCH